MNREGSETARTRRALLAHVRHELRTPLNGIIGYSEMLLEDARSANRDGMVPDLDKVHKAGMQLLSLVDEFLDPAKIESGVLDVDLAELGAAIHHGLRTPLDVVIGCSEILLEEAESAGLSDCIADLRHVRGAALKLLSMLGDIIGFAGTQAGSMPVGARGDSVSSLIQSVLTPSPSPRWTNARSEVLHRASLLVVDDNEINRDILARYLQRQNHEVATAAGGREALEMLAGRQFDLVLLDLVMPDMNGLQVLNEMKSDQALSRIPVILISALDDTLGKVQAFRAGAVDYVTKPFQAEEVIARVEGQLKISRLQKDLERQNRELSRKNEELVQAQKRTDLVFSALAEALPGTVLDDKYRLDEKIGTGGFGAVYRGTHLGLDLMVAVKVFRPLAGNDTPDALERFRQEGIAASRIKHPNAVEIFDNGISATGIVYLVMELLHGHTLAEELQEKRVLTPERTAAILVPVCEALAEIHAAGIVHRDIKPENIFLHRDRKTEVVKLLDFGLSKMLGRDPEQTLETMTMTGGVAGTPAYMAPERLMNKPYDGRSDVYSLGVVMYQMLCGRPPFQPEEAGRYAVAMMHLTAEPASMLRYNPDVPVRLDALVRRTLSKEPQDRPTASELAALIRASRREKSSAPLPS